MNEIILELKNNWNLSVDSVKMIPKSGSERENYIVETNSNKFVFTKNNDVSENESFIYFSRFLKSKNIAVPEIIKVAKDKKSYLQSFAGDATLLDVRLSDGFSDKVISLYYKTLDELFKFQTVENIDYSKCFDFKEFNSKLIIHDLYYFKNYFLDILNFPYSKVELLNEFEIFSNELQKLKPKGLMFRDFQSRNIMIQGNSLCFIDFQGAMLGNMMYDLISLIWQAKAEIPENLKTKFKEYYFQKIQTYFPAVSYKELNKSYEYCLIIRLLQVLGAYGFRGLIQKKQHFLESIENGQKNLNYILDKSEVLDKFPTLKSCINHCANTKIKI
ncbi:MAG: phosphotransferase [Flavobacteriales bacterium]|nr:phosphotransferase [Flavobacteriales bacterium]